MYYLNEEKKNEGKKKEHHSDALMKKFTETRQIIISGEVTEELAEKTVTRLLVLEADSATKPIYVYIDSPGGNVYSGFAIFDVIRFIKAPVKTIGMGLVASAASIILLAAKKANRFALPNSQYLIHQPLSEMRGVATDLEIHAREIERIKARINSLIASETGKKIEQIFQDTERDYWLNAEEATAYGLVSKIVETRKEISTK
ncbi:MAG: ATP-dependent Clp protease proteolytic subunit [Treponema sp.]